MIFHSKNHVFPSEILFFMVLNKCMATGWVGLLLRFIAMNQ